MGEFSTGQQCTCCRYPPQSQPSLGSYAETIATAARAEKWVPVTSTGMTPTCVSRLRKKDDARGLNNVRQIEIRKQLPDKHCVFSGDAKVVRLPIPIATQYLVAMPFMRCDGIRGLHTWRVPGRLRSRRSGAFRVSIQLRSRCPSDLTGGDHASVQVASLINPGKTKVKPRKNLL